MQDKNKLLKSQKSNKLKNKLFLKRIIKKKALQKSTFESIFRTQSLLVDKDIKNNRGLELATSSSSGYETSSEKFCY